MRGKEWRRMAWMLAAAMLALGGCAAKDEASGAAPTAQPTAQQAEAPGYVRITVGSESRWFALPTEGERVLTLRQAGEDGTEKTNEVHMTSEGVYMGAASCDNQDCVGQGMVTFDNREERVLSNWVICLPNTVSLELYASDEAAAAGALEGSIQ